jgi:predicted phosphodiesterase
MPKYVSHCRNKKCQYHKGGPATQFYQDFSKGGGKWRTICISCDKERRNNRRDRRYEKVERFSANLKDVDKMLSELGVDKAKWNIVGQHFSVSPRGDGEANVRYSVNVKPKQNQQLESSFLEITRGMDVPKLSPLGYARSRKSGERPLRVVTVVLSDLHFGSDIVVKRTGTQDYGAVEEARRLSKVVSSVCSYKLDHRKDTHLNVLILGDVIQNQLHDARDGDRLAAQSCRAIHLLSQAITRFAEAYPVVDVRCVTGNHGRFLSRHPTRAIHDKWDSLETVIYYSVKKACGNLANVDFHIPEFQVLSYNVCGQEVFATHGDTILKPGNPGKNINMAHLEHQISRINASLPDRREYKVFIVGHVHIASQTHLSSGAVLLTNGALIPADDFAVSNGILESHCGQWMFESVSGHPVGDSRLITVGSQDDKNVSLDKIILPWEP